MAETGQEKTEEATPRRRSEARQEGNVAKSQDLTAAFMLLAAVIGLEVMGMRVFTGMRNTMQTMLSGAHTSNPTQMGDLAAVGSFAARATMTMFAPLGLLMTGVALVASVGQVGFLLSGKAVSPNFKKLNPLNGVKQMFSARSVMLLVLSLGKTILIGLVAGLVIVKDMEAILHLAELSVLGAFAVAGRMVLNLAFALCAVLVILAVIDFAYQRWQHNQDLKMTKEEVKQELKNMDGDPLVRQRRARVARQLAMQRMAQAVPQADVVVTNPTHYAIALKYDSKTMTAPRVIAKGADFMAMRIRQIASLNGVPLVERKPLARALYAGVEIGQEVPHEHYAAVAEILAYVYRLSGKKAA